MAFEVGKYKGYPHGMKGYNTALCNFWKSTGHVENLEI